MSIVTITDNIKLYIETIELLTTKLKGLYNIKLIFYKVDKSIVEIVLKTNVTTICEVSNDNLMLFDEICDKLREILYLTPNIENTIEKIELYFTRMQPNEWHPEGSHIRAIIQLPIQVEEE